MFLPISRDDEFYREHEDEILDGIEYRFFEDPVYQKSAEILREDGPFMSAEAKREWRRRLYDARFDRFLDELFKPWQQSGTTEPTTS